MAKTYGEIRKRTIKLLDDYSTSGTITSTTDSLLKIRDFVNDAQVDLASSTAKIHGEKYINQSPVYNEYDRDTSSIVTFKPGDDDLSYTLTGAKSCFFEIIGPATVYIEESADGETYSTLETISVASSVDTFTAYRRLISPSDDDNTVRLRFTGSYIFHIRNYILYPYAFSAQADVQQHRPYFEYDLPSDFFELQYVMVKKDTRQFINYTNYILKPDKKIAFYRYDAPAEFIVHYWRLPTDFTFTDDDDVDDAQVFGIDSANSTYRVSDDAAIIIPFFTAASVLMSESNENLSRATILMNIYEQKKAALIGHRFGYQGNIPSLFGF